MSQRIGIEVTSVAGPGVLHQLSGVIAAHEGDIVSVEIVEARRTYFEIETPGDPAALVDACASLPSCTQVTLVDTMEKVYGKRIIIMGGGMQVGQVALGAITEADRHNIRGEHISVDTIPLVGEKPLADAVRAAARLPRVKAIVLAGSLMGGEIEHAVREVRTQGSPGRQPEHGRQRSGRRRPGGHRSGAGRRDDRHGRRRHREVYGGATDAPGVLSVEQPFSNASRVRPTAQQVMVNTCELHRINRLDRHVQIEQQRPVAIAAHHALIQKNEADSRAARHGAHVMQAGCRIQDHMARGQLHAVRSVGILHYQFPAVILIGMGQEKCRG